MGMQDRDWYCEAQREREKQRRIDATRAKFALFSRHHLGAKTMSPTWMNKNQMVRRLR